MSSQRNRPQIASLSEHITCVLCGGYMVDATAIMTCLHTFCKTCIVQYLLGSHYCPVCDEWIHHSNPWLKLRTDRTLQDLIYKLVPGMLSGETRRRQDYLDQNIAHGDSGVGDLSIVSSDSYDDGRLYTEHDEINVLLQFSPRGKTIRQKLERLSDVMSMDSDSKIRMRYRRYLQCPAPFTVGLMAKFLRLKFNISTELTIGLFHAGERLAEHYTLMDIAYIYSLKKRRLLRLYFSVFAIPSCSSPIIAAIQPPSPSMIRNDVINVESLTIARLEHNSMKSFDCTQSDLKELPLSFNPDPTIYGDNENVSTNRIKMVNRIERQNGNTYLRLSNDDVTNTRKVFGKKLDCGVVSTSRNTPRVTSSGSKLSMASRQRTAGILIRPVEKRIKSEIEPLSEEEMVVVPRKLSVTIDRCHLSSDFWSTVNNNTKRSYVGRTDILHHRRVDADDDSTIKINRDASGLSSDSDELHRDTSHPRLSVTTKPSLPVTISRDFVKELVFARGLEMLGRENNCRF